MNEDYSISLESLITSVQRTHPDADALSLLAAAVTMTARLGELSEHVIGHFVDQARDDGATWSDIGHSLGVSRQAAQKRYVPRGGFAGGPHPPGNLYESFTTAARDTILFADDEARSARNDSVGTEHLVLAFLRRPKGRAAETLVEQAITDQKLRAAVSMVLRPALAEPPNDLPFTTDLAKALQMARREAARLASDEVGTEHLLLGLLADEQCAGARVLHALGFDSRQVAS